MRVDIAASRFAYDCGMPQFLGMAIFIFISRLFPVVVVDQGKKSTIGRGEVRAASGH